MEVVLVVGDQEVVVVGGEEVLGLAAALQIVVALGRFGEAIQRRLGLPSFVVLV
jgi:hypothetical protein